MNYFPSVHSGSKVFFIPVDVINDIDMCSAQQLRGLLVALEAGGDGCSAEYLSEKLKISLDDAEDILKYWVKKEILDGKESEESRHDKCAPVNDTLISPPDIKPSMEEIQAYEKDEDVVFVLNESQRILGTTFSQSDTSTLVWLLKWAGLSPEVLVTVIQYCSDHKKTNLRYIQKVALEWIDSGIDTFEKAEERIRVMDAVESWEGKIKKIFCIGDRNFTAKEREYSECWRMMFIPFEMIEIAYERNIDNTGKLSFAYINKILVSWKQNGIDTPEKARNEKKVKKSDASSPSFNISELEKRMMLEDSVI